MPAINLDNVQLFADVPSAPQFAPSTTTVADILTQDALKFVVLLHRTFNKTRLQLLDNRAQQLEALDAGLAKLDFLPATKNIRDDPAWQGPPLAPGLINRSTEITGPPLRNMLILSLIHI